MLRKNASCVLFILMSWTSLVIPASAQHFEQVNGTLASVSAGRNEVFGVGPFGLPWRYNAATKSFATVAGAKSLVQIAVGGGTLLQLDEVWAVASSGATYRFNYSTQAFDQIPGVSFTQIIVGEGAAQNLFSSSLNPDKCYPYEVWGIGPSDGGTQFARYNFCENTFNSGFVFNTGPGGAFTQGATGGGDVWVLNKQDAPWHYIDSEGGLFVGNVPLTQITVGVNDVWGLNSSNQIFRYDPNTNAFVQQAGTLRQVAAGGDGVWGINLIDEVFRWDPSSQSFVQVDGIVLTSIAVGSGAGVWGVNSSDQVFAFVRP